MNAKGPEAVAEVVAIGALIEAELKSGGADDADLVAFRGALQAPRAITVNFSGGLAHKCWAVTRPNGPYRVVYMPLAGYFSLCVDSFFGPVDIGVHGRAMDCYGSV